MRIRHDFRVLSSVRRGAPKRDNIQNVKLNHLVELDIIIINGNKYDPNHTYSMK